MSYRGVSRLRPTATLRSLSHSEEPSPGQTEARQIEPVKTPPQTSVPLARQTEIDNNTVADNSDRKESIAEPAQVDEDWKMGSPSPIELTYAPTHFHQLYEYEDQDIDMASPPHSPTPNEVQDSATRGSSWGADLRSPTPNELQDSATWESSWGADPSRFPIPNEVQDSTTWGSSWDADLPRPPTPTQARDSATWGSSRGADPPHSPTPTQVQNSSTWGSSTWDSSPWDTDPSHSPTQDSAPWGSSTW